MVDRLEDLASTVQNLTIYDVKSWYNKGKAFVMNYTEMETKVREATNDDPWGASSTLMAEIAQGTFNYQHFNEIMPTVYSRFMEKEARQWRQIFKALQLLEYLIKNGSERVVDDCRSHISTIKMLRSFHYIDDKGKDQGINIRHRSKEITELLNDLDAIRAERKKAKANRAKYSGESTGFGGTGKKYGGFGGGSDQYGSYGDSGYSSRGTTSQDNGYGGGESTFHDSGRSRSFSQSQNGGFEEYDAGDEEDESAKRKIGSEPTTHAPKANEVVPDLFSFGDEDESPSSGAKASNDNFSSFATATNNADDDFDDFQSAPTPASTGLGTAPTSASLPAPIMAKQPTPAPSFDLFLQGPSALTPSISSSRSTTSTAMKPSQAVAGSAATSSPTATATAQRPAQVRSPSGLVMDRKGLVSHAAPRPSNSPATVPPAGPAANSFGFGSSTNTATKSIPPANDGFADLWLSTKAASGAVDSGKDKSNMASLAQQSSSQLWSNPASNNAPSKPGNAQAGNGLDDLLF